MEQEKKEKIIERILKEKELSMKRRHDAKVRVFDDSITLIKKFDLDTALYILIQRQNEASQSLTLRTDDLNEAYHTVTAILKTTS